MKRLPLANSTAHAWVDDEDFDALVGSEWRLLRSQGRPQCYATRPDPAGAKLPQKMEYAIMGDPPPGHVWDHRNGNGLDNRRENLRAATHQQNVWNTRKKLRSSRSRFKGIDPGRRGSRWCARITVDGKRVWLGQFATEREAAEAYDDAARRYFGEFACVNFPRPGERSCR